MKEELEKMIVEIHAATVLAKGWPGKFLKLSTAATAVLAAWNDKTAAGWQPLKNALADLEIALARLKTWR